MRPLIPRGPGLRSTRGVERPRATDAASSEAKAGMLAEPLGLLSRVAARGCSLGAGHSAWPNTRYVINALANSTRSGVAGPTRLRIVRRSSSGSLAILLASAITRPSGRGHKTQLSRLAPRERAAEAWTEA